MPSEASLQDGWPESSHEEVSHVSKLSDIPQNIGLWLSSIKATKVNGSLTVPA